MSSGKYGKASLFNHLNLKILELVVRSLYKIMIIYVCLIVFCSFIVRLRSLVGWCTIRRMKDHKVNGRPVVLLPDRMERTVVLTMPEKDRIRYSAILVSRTYSCMCGFVLLLRIVIFFSALLVASSRRQQRRMRWGVIM
jgi:hypothetical protein